MVSLFIDIGVCGWLCSGVGKVPYYLVKLGISVQGSYLHAGKEGP